MGVVKPDGTVEIRKIVINQDLGSKLEVSEGLTHRERTIDRESLRWFSRRDGGEDCDSEETDRHSRWQLFRTQTSVVGNESIFYRPGDLLSTQESARTRR